MSFTTTARLVIEDVGQICARVAEDDLPAIPLRARHLRKRHDSSRHETFQAEEVVCPNFSHGAGHRRPVAAVYGISQILGEDTVRLRRSEGIFLPLQGMFVSNYLVGCMAFRLKEYMLTK